jgi:DNA-binding IclR family transcriptional regulator
MTHREAQTRNRKEPGMATPRIQSVDRAFSLLAQLTDRGGTRLPVLAEGAGLSVATAHRLLATLESLGVIVRTGSNGYQLGMLVHELAQRSSPNEVLSATAAPLLRKLVRQAGLTAHVAVLNEELMVDYVARECPTRGFRVPTRMGSQLEAYCSGLGKVLLAGLGEETLDAYLDDGPFVALTERTIVDPEMLRAELKRIRQQGYAVDDREIYDDLRCVAVPLRNRRGDVVAALSLAGNTADLTAERVPEIVALLGEQSAELMRKLFPAAPGRLTN